MALDLRPWLDTRFVGRIEKHGNEWAIACPECDEDRKRDFRLWFNVEKNIGTCYKCGKVFTPIQLVKDVDGVGLSDALRLIRENTSSATSMEALRKKVSEAFTDKADEALQKPPRLQLPQGFKSCLDTRYQRWPKFVMEKIGSRETARAYRIGWCETGFYARRLIVPIVFGGKIVSFIARDMTGKAERKVLYPKGTKTSLMLFNYDRAQKCEQVVLVEGCFDAIRLGRRAMAVFGTTLSRTQIALLVASRARDVAVMFDGDEAGRKGTRKVVGTLRDHFKRLRAVKLPWGNDPDDYSRDVAWQRIESTPLVERSGAGLATFVRDALEGRK